MSKFKVGDLVKVISADDEERKKYVGVIGKIIEDTGPAYRWLLTTTGEWLFRDDELELIEESTKQTELKATIVEVDNVGYKIIKKEGNKMIESINLIDLYASKHKENIERETKEKIEELRKNCDVINKYNELVEQFERECDDLYLSQFTEEERNKLIINDNVEYDNKPLIHSDMWRNKYSINYTYTNDEIMQLETDMVNKVEELNDLVKTVKAHVGIAKTKEEVEEILTRYGIIDKKGKLVIK